MKLKRSVPPLLYRTLKIVAWLEKCICLCMKNLKTYLLCGNSQNDTEGGMGCGKFGEGIVP